MVICLIPTSWDWDPLQLGWLTLSHCMWPRHVLLGGSDATNTRNEAPLFLLNPMLNPHVPIQFPWTNARPNNSWELIHGGWTVYDRDWSVRKSSFAFRRVHAYNGLLAGIKRKIQNEKAHDPWPKTCNIDRGKWAAIGQSNHRHRRQSGTLSSERRWNSSVDDGACQHWSRVATNGGLWCDNFNTLCSSE